MLEKMILDYKIHGSRVDEVLFHEVMKVLEKVRRLEERRYAEQERVTELENRVRELRDGNLRLSSKAESLLDRNNVLRSDLTANRNLYDLSAKRSKRYREALEFYAAEDIYEWETYYNPQQQMDCMVIDDGGHRARKALEESK